MKTLLFLTGVLLASTSTCDNRKTSGGIGQECAVSTLRAGTVNLVGGGKPAVAAPADAKSARPALPAHLFM